MLVFSASKTSWQYHLTETICWDGWSCYNMLVFLCIQNLAPSWQFHPSEPLVGLVSPPPICWYSSESKTQLPLGNFIHSNYWWGWLVHLLYVGIPLHPKPSSLLVISAIRTIGWIGWSTFCMLVFICIQNLAPLGNIILQKPLVVLVGPPPVCWYSSVSKS
jgi:hypothetical protein